MIRVDRGPAPATGIQVNAPDATLNTMYVQAATNGSPWIYFNFSDGSRYTRVARLEIEDAPAFIEALRDIVDAAKDPR